jgi:BirA family biotin operon repressor/biotin-[acetyl-CoA-carboxylase] ligase
VITRPEAGEGIQTLSVRIGIALAEYLDACRPAGWPSVGLKWPNDLLLHDRKLGGILCEARWHGERLGWIVVGVGLNVHNPLPDSTDREAARLADHGYSGDVAVLGEALAGVVARVTHSAAPLSDAELAAFDVRDSLHSRP